MLKKNAHDQNEQIIQVLIPAVVVFFVKVITENQLYNFLINSRHSYKNIVFTVAHYEGYRRSSDKIWAQDGSCFVKNCHFPAFFFGDHDFYSLIELISFIDSLHQKIAKA